MTMDQNPPTSDQSQEQHKEQIKEPGAVNSFDFVWVSFFPASIGKIMVLYFGINYSNYPGEGYGIGLALSILYTCITLAHFLWKYRNYQD